jgi:hypothetical protein
MFMKKGVQQFRDVGAEGATWNDRSATAILVPISVLLELFPKITQGYILASEYTGCTSGCEVNAAFLPSLVACLPN